MAMSCLPHNISSDNSSEPATVISKTGSVGLISLIRDLKPGTWDSICVKLLRKSALKTNTRGVKYLFMYFADFTGQVAGIALNELAKLANVSMSIGSVYMICSVRVDSMQERHYKHISGHKSAVKVQIVLNNNTTVETCIDKATIKLRPIKFKGRVVDVRKSRQPYTGCPKPDCAFPMIRVSRGGYFCSSCKQKYSEPTARHKIFYKITNSTTNFTLAAYCCEKLACDLLRVDGQTFGKMEKAAIAEWFVNSEYEFTCVQKIQKDKIKNTRITDARLCAPVQDVVVK